MEVSENVRLTVMNGYWHLGHKGSTFVEPRAAIAAAGETKNATQKNGTKAAHNEIRAATTSPSVILSLLSY